MQRAGIPQAVARAVMGHRTDAMTRRYQQHEAAMTPGQAQKLEEVLFQTA